MQLHGNSRFTEIKAKRCQYIILSCLMQFTVLCPQLCSVTLSSKPFWHRWRKLLLPLTFSTTIKQSQHETYSFRVCFFFFSSLNLFCTFFYFTASVSNHHFLPVKVLNALQSSHFSIFCLISWADSTSSVSRCNAFVFINTEFFQTGSTPHNRGLCHVTALSSSLVTPLIRMKSILSFLVNICFQVSWRDYKKFI